MATNRGKQFESVIREAFNQVPNTSVIRLHDQTNGFKGSQNICDFVIYHYPYQFLIECKSVHGNRLPFANITDTQYMGLLESSNITGVHAGIICWWIDKDVTKFIPIALIQRMRLEGMKSYPHDFDGYVTQGQQRSLIMESIPICGKKKRVFFDYDMSGLFEFFLIS